MADSIQVFNSEDFGSIRAIKIEDEPWFVAKDVCDALGIATNHLREEGRGLDDDEIANLPNWEGKGAALMEDNARLLPKATMYDVAIEADGTMSVTEAARYLSQLDRNINRKRLYALLRADGLICKQDNAPTKRAISSGYMVQMMTTRSDGKANKPYAHITRKGLDWCINHYCKAHIVA